MQNMSFRENETMSFFSMGDHSSVFLNADWKWNGHKKMNSGERKRFTFMEI